MYSVVIADDELIMRNGLVNMMNWEEIGFQVAGVFSDGQELLDYLKINMPDVILTDIKMSQVNGIEIARFIKEQNLPIQVVFLSGYRDFGYAQSAVEYQVTHYLVKPISMAKLREIFVKLREELDRQSNFQNAMLNRVERYQKLLNYEKQNFVIDAWFGKLTDDQQLERRLQLLNCRLAADGLPSLFLVRLVLNGDSKCWQFLADYGVQEFQEQVESIMGTLDRRLEYYSIEWTGSDLSVGFSCLGVLWVKEEIKDEVYDIDLRMLEKELQRKICSLIGGRAKLNVLKEIDTPLELVRCVGTLKTVDSTNDQEDTRIEKVLGYIREHYSEDITLADIAGEVFLNPIYLSRLIKETLGKNYTELLMEFRIAKAVELLKNTDMYVYEIAESVGYHNLKYFYKIFKKIKGKSPNDYRQKKV